MIIWVILILMAATGAAAVGGVLWLLSPIIDPITRSISPDDRQFLNMLAAVIIGGYIVTSSLSAGRK